MLATAPRSLLFAAMVTGLLGLGVGASVVGGRWLEEQAEAAWRAEARQESARLTEIASSAIDRARTALRGVATAFHGPGGDGEPVHRIGDAAFRKAVDLAQGWEAVAAFEAVAYARRLSRLERPALERRFGRSLTVADRPAAPAPHGFESFAVTLTTSEAGPLARLADLASHDQMGEAAATAYRNPDTVAVSPAFRDAADRLKLLMAFATPNADQVGIVAGLVDLDRFFERLAASYGRRGLSLRLAQRETEVGEEAVETPLIGALSAPPGAVASFTHRIAHGEARWRLSWDATADFAGGPALAFARSVTYGGSLLTLLVAALVGLLALQNVRVNARVVKRTAELARARDEAETANRSKSAFLATMSHELRTPLNAVIGFAEVLSGEVFGPLGSAKYKDYADHIRDSGQHLLKVINDILDLSKAEAGKLDLHEERVSLPFTVETCMRLVENQAARAGLALERRLAADLPPLLGDERQMRQILLNLLSNAIKFTPTGGRVTVSADRAADGGVVLAVADTGIGIPTDGIATALSTFGQVDNSFRRKYQGAGLGLPLVKSLVEAHGGVLDLHSVPRAGTTVTVRLPPERICRHAAVPTRPS